MSALIRHATRHRAAIDWLSVAGEVVDKARAVVAVDRFFDDREAAIETVHKARRIIDAYPTSPGAKVLGEMLETGDAALLDDREHLQGLRAARADLLEAAALPPLHD